MLHILAYFKFLYNFVTVSIYAYLFSNSIVVITNILLAFHKLYFEYVALCDDEEAAITKNNT